MLSWCASVENLLDELGLGAGLEESIIPGVTGRSGVWSQHSSSDTTREELSFRADSVKAAEPRPRSAAATERRGHGAQRLWSADTTATERRGHGAQRPRSAAATERSDYGAQIPQPLSGAATERSGHGVQRPRRNPPPPPPSAADPTGEGCLHTSTVDGY